MVIDFVRTDLRNHLVQHFHFTDKYILLIAALIFI